GGYGAYAPQEFEKESSDGESAERPHAEVRARVAAVPRVAAAHQRPAGVSRHRLGSREHSPRRPATVQRPDLLEPFDEGLPGPVPARVGADAGADAGADVGVGYSAAPSAGALSVDRWATAGRVFFRKNRYEIGPDPKTATASPAAFQPNPSLPRRLWKMTSTASAMLGAVMSTRPARPSGIRKPPAAPAAGRARRRRSDP